MWATTIRLGDLVENFPLPGISPTHLCGERCEEANVRGNLVRTPEVRIDQQTPETDLIPFGIVLRLDSNQVVCKLGGSWPRPLKPVKRRRCRETEGWYPDQETCAIEMFPAICLCQVPRFHEPYKARQSSLALDSSVGALKALHPRWRSTSSLGNVLLPLSLRASDPSSFQARSKTRKCAQLPAPCWMAGRLRTHTWMSGDSAGRPRIHLRSLCPKIASP